MIIYPLGALPWTTDSEGNRRIEFMPASLRQITRGLVNEAFCWDATGYLRPNYIREVKSFGMKKDLTTVAIVQVGVEESFFLNYINSLGGLIECPWGFTIPSLCAASLATADYHYQILKSIGMDIGLNASDRAIQIAEWLAAWEPADYLELQSRDYYLTVLDPDTLNVYPNWLLNDGQPDMDLARTFLETLSSDEANPRRLACTLFQLLRAQIIFEGTYPWQ